MCDVGLCKQYGCNVFCSFEYEQMLGVLGKTTFEPLKKEQEDGIMTNVVVEKQVNFLNESFIKKFKHLFLANHGTSSATANSFFAR